MITDTQESTLRDAELHLLGSLIELAREGNSAAIDLLANKYTPDAIDQHARWAGDRAAAAKAEGEAAAAKATEEKRLGSLRGQGRILAALRANAA